LRQFLFRIAQKAFLRVFRRIHTVRGFRVVLDNFRPDIRSKDVLARFEEAVELLERTQPWRLAHIRRDVYQFWIARKPVRGAFYSDGPTIMTELTFLARRDIGAEVVAACILHEGVHARIHHWRRRMNANASARHERICRRAELAFGHALGERGAAVVSRAAESLALADEEISPEIDWAEASREMNRLDAETLMRRFGAA
jgi:hypothetical protein